MDSKVNELGESLKYNHSFIR